MKVGNLTLASFADKLSGTGLAIRSGPFVSRIISELPDLAASLYLLYGEFPVVEDALVDFHIRVKPADGVYRRLRQQIVFTLDRQEVFFPAAQKLSLPLFEWGMNWCVYRNANQYVVLHAAVVQKGSRTCLLPGSTGAGKSTLCAALVSRGWRLLSDELAIWRPSDALMLPVSRPISLKNQSIELIKAFAPEQVFGPCFINTAKGTIAHMRPPSESVDRMDEPATATHIVFPSFQFDSGPELRSVSKKDAFVRISDYALNYPIQGLDGFNSLVDIIDSCASYDFRYASLDDAIRVFDDLS